MSYRLSFPQGYDPHMRKEEMVTLSRLSSQQNATLRANGSPSTMQTSVPKASQPRRRHFVFADPVAFRYAVTRAEMLLELIIFQISGRGSCNDCN